MDSLKLKDEFNKTQGEKWLIPWSDKKEIEYQAAYIKFLEEKIEELTTPIDNKSSWNIGDKVIVTDCINGHEFKIGMTVEIIEYDGSCQPSGWLCSDGNITWWLSEKEGEKLDKSKQNINIKN